jgi:hypothetical protein
MTYPPHSGALIFLERIDVAGWPEKRRRSKRQGKKAADKGGSA